MSFTIANAKDINGLLNTTTLGTYFSNTVTTVCSDSGCTNDHGAGGWRLSALPSNITGLANFTSTHLEILGLGTWYTMPLNGQFMENGFGNPQSGGLGIIAPNNTTFPIVVTIHRAVSPATKPTLDFSITNRSGPVTTGREFPSSFDFRGGYPGFTSGGTSNFTSQLSNISMTIRCDDPDTTNAASWTKVVP